MKMYNTLIPYALQPYVVASFSLLAGTKPAKPLTRVTPIVPLRLRKRIINTQNASSISPLI